MDKQKPPPRDPNDPLKHFSKDGPFVRLTALVICRLHLILYAAGACFSSVVAFAIGRAIGKW